MIAIVAVDQNWGIGRAGDQLVYLKEDLKRFKSLTTGNTIILGRKTLATFPGGKPLKQRRNLILSRNPDYAPEGGEVYADVETLIEQVTDPDHTYVVGGASVYERMLPLCEKAHVTKIEAQYPADCWFPNLDEHPDWEEYQRSQPMEQDGIRYFYVEYRKKK